MIQLTTATLEKAINKARTVKPRVRVNKFGNYTVTNKATGAIYIVTCTKRDSKRVAHCTCKGWGTRTGVLSRRQRGGRAHRLSGGTCGASVLNHERLGMLSHTPSRRHLS